MDVSCGFLKPNRNGVNRHSIPAQRGNPLKLPKAGSASPWV